MDNRSSDPLWSFFNFLSHGLRWTIPENNSVFLVQQWVDERLKYTEATYGGNLSTLRMPSNKVWQPEVALVST